MKNMETMDEYIYLRQQLKLVEQNQTTEKTRRMTLGRVSFSKMSNILKNEEVPINLRRKIFNPCFLPVEWEQLY